MKLSFASRSEIGTDLIQRQEEIDNFAFPIRVLYDRRVLVRTRQSSLREGAKEEIPRFG